MKLPAKIAVSAVLATAIATPAFAGSAGVVRSAPTAQVDETTLAELQTAAAQNRQEAMDGNKNNLAFRRKDYEIEQLIAKIQNGQPVQEAQLDEALAPVHVW
jgi:guanyl-specific ribonuclease Sa